MGPGSTDGCGSPCCYVRARPVRTALRPPHSGSQGKHGCGFWPGDEVLADLTASLSKIPLSTALHCGRKVKSFGVVLSCGVGPQLRNRCRRFDEIFFRDTRSIWDSVFSQPSLFRLVFWPPIEHHGRRELGLISRGRFVRLRHRFVVLLKQPQRRKMPERAGQQRSSGLSDQSPSRAT